MNEFIISYEELLILIRGGIMRRTVKGTSLRSIEGLPKVKGAFAEGIYGGSPGKEIYSTLPHLTEDQIREVAKEFAINFLTVPPINHVVAAVCIRYIYGQLAKQGVHRSKEDFERMKKEKQEWELPRRFIGLVRKEFEKINNFYGLCILCEMEGHRLGDEAVLNKDEQKLIEMEEMYLKSVSFAHKCNSYKHMFTPYYWAFRCFYEFKDHDKAMQYALLTMDMASQYCPDTRNGYVTKLLDCIWYMKKYDKDKYKDIVEKYKKNTNKCIKKVFDKKFMTTSYFKNHIKFLQ